MHATCPPHAILVTDAINSCLLMVSYALAKRFLWVCAGDHNQRPKIMFFVTFDTKYICLSDLHHLDSRIKRDQLGATCFFISLFNAQHISDVNTSILRSLRLICWVIWWVVLLWFDVCWCYGVVWLGWCGIRMQAEAVAGVVRYPDAGWVVHQPASRYHTTPAKPQRNTNTHRTRAIQPMK